MSGSSVPPPSKKTPPSQGLGFLRKTGQSIWNALYVGGAIDRVMQWALFNVGITLVPLVATYILLITEKDLPNPGIWDNLPAKELLIISTALTGDAIGSLFKSTFNRTIRIVIGGVCVCLLVFTTILFSRVPDAPMEVKSVEEIRVADYGKSGSLEKSSSAPRLNSSSRSKQLLAISRQLFFASLAIGVSSKAIE